MEPQEAALKLIGQFDSPFTRRVAVTLALYGMAFEHVPWSTVADADRLAAVNPLMRVPVLVLGDGEALTDTSAIIDHLDDIAGPARALLPRTGAARRRVLAAAALCAGVSDKAVALFYETALHPAPSEFFAARCKTQISGTLDLLERGRAAGAALWWFGDDLGHADIMLGCTLRHLGDVHPALFDTARHRALASHARACEALPVFAAHQQAFAPPV